MKPRSRQRPTISDTSEPIKTPNVQVRRLKDVPKVSASALRCLVTYSGSAASMPPARWKTSTTSPRFTSRDVRRISSPFAPNAPFPSQRSKLSLRLRRTSSPRPRRSASASAARQWFLQHAQGRPPPAPEERHPESGPLQQRLPGTEVAQQDSDPAAVRVERVGLQRDVVAEPLGLLVRVGVAPHPGEQPGVVDDRPLGLVQAQWLAHPERDQGLPDDVLHRLPQPEVGAQRQGGHQLGQPDLGALSRRHRASLANRIGDVPPAEFEADHYRKEVSLVPVFATVQATEEAVLNALVSNEEMVGFRGHRSPALPRERVVELLRARGVIV